MAFKLLKRMKKPSLHNDSNLNLLRPFDIAELIVFLFSLLVCMIIFIVEITVIKEKPMYDYITILMFPFFVIGLMSYFRGRAWIALVILILANVIFISFNIIDTTILYLLDFIFVGSVGVVTLVIAIQRVIFYRVMRSVEYLNIKKKITVWDKIVAFFFNIPKDLDTRNLTMDCNTKRPMIPWRNILFTVKNSTIIGVFIWIYISMNPQTGFYNVADNMMQLFTILLIVPVIVLPWAIFRSLNVRIETKYRDFSLYSGINETLKRMTLPMLAAFIFVLLAFNKADPVAVLTFIMLSIVMNVFIIVLTCVVYYVFFENKLISDIVARWKIYRPVTLLMDIKDENRYAVLPGTPVRDTSDISAIRFKDQ